MTTLKPIEEKIIIENSISDGIASMKIKELLTHPILLNLQTVVKHGSIQIKEADIRSDKALKETIDYLSILKGYRKAYDDLRKTFVDPINKEVKLINGFLNPLLKSLDSLEADAKRKATKWQMKKEDDARIERERIDAENRKKQEEYERAERERLQKEEQARKEAKKNNEPIPEPEPEIIDIPVFEKPKERDSHIKGNDASGSFRKKKVIQNIDLSKIPVDYLIADTKKIQRVIDAGVDILGVTWKEEKVLAIR